MHVVVTGCYTKQCLAKYQNLSTTHLGRDHELAEVVVEVPVHAHLVGHEAVPEEVPCHGVGSVHIGIGVGYIDGSAEVAAGEAVVVVVRVVGVGFRG